MLFDKKGHVSYYVDPMADTKTRLQEIKKVLKKDPKNPILLRLHAENLSRTRNREEALFEIEKAKQYGLTESSYLKSLDIIFQELSDLKAKEKVLRKLIQLNPKSVSGWDNLLYMFRQTNARKAIQICKKLISLTPKQIRYYRELAWLYREIKEVAKFVTTMKQIIKKFPKSADDWTDLAHYYFETGSLKKSCEIWEKIFKMDDRLLYYNHNSYFRGLTALGQFQKALKLMDKVIKQFGKETYMLIDRAETNSILKKYNAAITDYTELAVLEPDNNEWHTRLAEMYNLLGKKQTALAHLNKADKIYSVQPPFGLSFTLGLINYSSKQEMQQQLNKVNKNLKQYPTQSNYDSKFQLLQALGKFTEALKVLEKLPKTRQNWSDRLQIQVQLRDKKGAVSSIKELLKLFPNNPDALLEVGKAYETLKMYSEAIRLQKIYISKFPLDYSGYTGLNSLATANEDFKLALKFVSEGVLRLPHDIEMKYDRLSLLRSLKLNSQALKVVKEIIKLDPNNPSRLVTYSGVLADNKKFKEAIKVAKSLKKYFSDGTAVFSEAYVYRKKGDFEAGRDILQKLHDKRPWIIRFHEEMAYLCEDEGKIDEAVYHAEEFYNYGKLPDYALYLAELYFKQKNKNKAIKILAEGVKKQTKFATPKQKVPWAPSLAFIYSGYLDSYQLKVEALKKKYN